MRWVILLLTCWAAALTTWAVSPRGFEEYCAVGYREQCWCWTIERGWLRRWTRSWAPEFVCYHEPTRRYVAPTYTTDPTERGRPRR